MTRTRTISACHEQAEEALRRRALNDVRQYARTHADEIAADWAMEPDTVSEREMTRRHLAAMSAERRAELNGEWA